MMTKRYSELVAGDRVLNRGRGFREVHNVVQMEMGFIRVYWVGSATPTQQPGDATVTVKS